ncbi:dehydroquinate synthase/iron-containing alcohol dehydrogenase family protein [Duncaniella dubosii]
MQRQHTREAYVSSTSLTLLAAVDAAVGGKTGINFEGL